ncbi:hypothetical protein HYH03_008506 [Edaphochlamys debaryana]|uniref:Uncharacterized protein n=1 Tax=Edaphochlamys debaryana TaxID=47281 RepID=A0A836BZH2_9CHLO|nr:hypothetical protein HYH03_008506 [Edaphochlamys debaryana]|eukprot:KAG2493374.1 hypothetical protein HYH03_008506 [Edaphochlamys debaryana]
MQLKSGEPALALTSKLLENLVSGARAPPAPTPAPGPAPQPSAPATDVASTSTPAAGATAAVSPAPEQGRVSNPGAASGGPNAAASSNGGAAAATSAGASTTSPDGAGTDATAGAGSDPAAAVAAVPETLLEAGTLALGGDKVELCGAYRSVCAVVFVQLVSHCLAVSEQDTWAVLYGLKPDEAESDGEAGPGAASASSADGGGGAEAAGLRPADGGSASGAEAGGMDDRAMLSKLGLGPNGLGDAQAGSAGTRVVYEEVEAAEQDDDDFCFEELELAPRGGADASTSGTAGPARAQANGANVPPYSWPALRDRLIYLSGQVSYVLLDEPALWSDGQLLQGVFRLLRALGAHRHAQELAPLLHAYVGLVCDRLAAEPGELGSLEGLWDAVGVPALASMPQSVGYRRRTPGALPLLAEASSCLSLVASLAGQLTGASARQRLWQQVHAHVLPLMERCLGELARAVGPGPGAGAKPAASAKAGAGAGAAADAAGREKEEDKAGPGPEEVAAIVLVCQVLEFYVQQRPGNADLGASLKASGVLASLARLFAAAAALTGAEPLRGAALGCAASSGELAAWMLAVPGVAKALAGPEFQEGGRFEAHGAVWELLSKGGASPLALSILSGGAAPEKAVRIHLLLSLLTKAAACRGHTRGLWGPALDRALRDLMSGLRCEAGLGAAASAAAPKVAAQGSVAGPATPNSEREGGAAEAAAAGEGGPAEVEQGGEAGPPGVEVGVEAGMEEEEEEEDDDAKLHLLDPEALQRRRARQLHPGCWRMLKQLLTEGGDARGSKTD